MTYEKYIWRDGKKYGPYKYHSRRVDGKVVTEYQGSKENVPHTSLRSVESSKHSMQNRMWVFILLGGIFLAATLLFLVRPSLTGFVTFNPEEIPDRIVVSNESLTFTLLGGELLPEETIVKITQGDQVFEKPLSELLSARALSGSWYLSGADILGTGNGFGVMGEKESYPEVSFKLAITEPLEQDTENSQNETSPPNNSESTSTGSSGGGSSTDSSSEIDTANPGESTTNPISSEEIPSAEDSVSEETTSNPTEVPSSSSESSSETTSDTSSETTESSSSETETSPENSNADSGSESSSNSESSSDSSSDSSSESSGSSESSSDSSDSGDSGSSVASAVAQFFRPLTLTGFSIAETTAQEIEGSTKKDNSFTYTIKKGSSVDLISGSVSVGDISLPDSTVDISILDSELIVTTDYTATEEGFGEAYLTDNYVSFTLTPEQFNLSSFDSSSISFEYEGTTLFNSEQVAIVVPNTSIIEPVLNETILNETNKTLVNTTSVFAFNISLTENERATLLDTFGNISITTTAYELNDRVIVRHALEDYWSEFSYDAKLDSQQLESYVEYDRISWLKDLAKLLTQKVSTPTNRSDLSGSYVV